MSGFAAWGLTILGLATVITVAEMLLPQGRTAKVVRSVFATVTVLVAVTPLPSLIGNGGADILGGGGEIVTDSAYLSYIDGTKGNIIGMAGEQYLKSKGYDGIKLAVGLDGATVKTVTVDFSDFCISGGSGHIHKKEIIKLVADYFGVGEEAVMTYG